MNGDSGKNNLLIPIENDDEFYNIYHFNTPSNKKFNQQLKSSYDFDNNNPFNELNKINNNSSKHRKMKLPILNLKFQRAHKIPSLLTRIPFSGKKSGKLYKKDQMIHDGKYLNINNVILDEHSLIKKNAINENILMKRYIKLNKKNLINRNIINQKYEKDMKEFKIFSHNMNDMIAEQMVIEFFKRLDKLKSLKFNDLLLNYFLSCDGKNILFQKKGFQQLIIALII